VSLVALGLIFTAAFLHATWNLLVKRVGGGAPFVWLFGALSAAIYAPLALTVIVVRRPDLGPLEVGVVCGSAVIHIGYYLALQRGYRAGELSLVYPLARGTGPLLATLGAIVLLGERPTSLALVGAAVVVASVFALAGGPRLSAGAPNRGHAVGYGLLTGAIIATYTLWDKQAVAALLIPPVVLDWGSNLTRTLLMSPMAYRRRTEIAVTWRSYRREALAVAMLNPLGYILVLTAMTFTPVSYVAPAREISILVGTALGARLLAEGEARRRLLAASAMVVGVIALAFG
jgi:drug/metabolite transporter (DMT)-like permease